MKPNRIIDHRQRIRRVATYIDDHIDSKLTLQSLAAVACLSPFHFQRVYQQLVGETPADTVRRLRLARAATQIANGEVSVTEAAITAGYGSSQAFCRAFRRGYGVAPSRLKKAGSDWLSLNTPAVVEFAVLSLPAQIGYGLRYNGADWDGGWTCCQIISRAISDHVWDPVTGGMFVQYRSDPLADIDGVVDADICIVRDDQKLVASGLERFELRGGDYAVLRLPGSMRTALPRIRQILHNRLPDAGLVRRPAPMLRRFIKDPALTPPSEWMFDLYVPVEQRLGLIAGDARLDALESRTGDASDNVLGFPI